MELFRRTIASRKERSTSKFAKRRQSETSSVFFVTLAFQARIPIVLDFKVRKEIKERKCDGENLRIVGERETRRASLVLSRFGFELKRKKKEESNRCFVFVRM